jgi:hypothetical protein
VQIWNERIAFLSEAEADWAQQSHANRVACTTISGAKAGKSKLKKKK